MLVISRKVDESLLIGDTIVVTVLAIEGDRVKIGINAPRETIILRQEIYQAVQDQVKIQELMAKETESETFEQLRKLLLSETEKENEKQEKSEDTP
ncbi:MAG: carbon storage regulator CsrA [Anaerolineales bacterium]|jgi:carbon storage regulator|uniref:carbon storage regulator CsrA n=1 Tax=Candidatus Villigracilis saccharophilus TaxID=3140684 RepID=UPI003136F848|nr:carbon storage regulator CsrA [Anaerolineales bacterium]MBK8422003.1 carbon storage regulator CsrA [Anaerolineales bacterium]